MKNKIVIGKLKGFQSKHPGKIVLGTLVKDAESGANQERDRHGQFASEANVVPHGANEMRVAGADIRIGDVLRHGNPLMNGGRVVQITPPKEGKEDRGARIKLEFKNGKTIANYFKPGGSFVVVRGTQAQPLTAPAKEPNRAGAPKPEGVAKPEGAAKPEAPKPAAERAQDNQRITQDDRQYSRSHTLTAKQLQVGDLIRNDLGITSRVLGVKPVPGGMREVTLLEQKGVTKVIMNSQENVRVKVALDLMPLPSERQVPVLQVRDVNDNFIGGLGRIRFASLEVGDYVKLPYNPNAPYGTPSSITGDLVGTRDMGRGRIDYYVRNNEDGRIYVKTYTEAQRAGAGRNNAMDMPRVIKPLGDTEWKAYEKIAASQIRIKEERDALARAQAEQEKIDRQIEQERRAALEAPENDRRIAEVAALQSNVDAKIAELNASSPAQPFSAGDVRNGGWGMTNAQLASIAAIPGNMEGATIQKVNVGGAINEGTYRVEAADGTGLFAKKIASGYQEIAHEILGSLISQRIGLNAPATLPCYISSDKIITDPSKLPAGKSFNGVVMERIEGDNGKPLPFGRTGVLDLSNAEQLAQATKMQLFDNMIGNTDRHEGNYFVHPTAGPIPYDAGFGFGNIRGSELGAGQMLYTTSNGTTNDIQRDVASNTNNQMSSRVNGEQPRALMGMLGTTLMTTSTLNPDSTVTLTPTAFAASLRDNITAAIADFQRSYQNDGLNVKFSQSPGGIASDEVGKQISGTGIGMLAGALNQLTGVGSSIIERTSGSKIQFNDPSKVLSTVLKGIASLINKVKIGTLIRKQ